MESCPSESVSEISTSSVWTHKPHGTFARALYQKQLNDENLLNLDKNQWYNCNLSDMPLQVSSKFIQLSLDEDTHTFLQNSIEKSDWIWTQIWHCIAKAFLSWFMTQTSINGFLSRGSMFVVSNNQFMSLLKRPNCDISLGTLLDLGAGDGEVTAKISPAFDKVYVTEMSSTMQGILQKKGFELLDVENWQESGPFNFISCLNLLDRCDKPITLLKEIRSALKDDGFLMVALVLPFSQYVETGRPDHKPTEKLPIQGETLEEQVSSAVENLFEPNGFELFSWSRVPYLCEGDLGQCYYWLDDALFILKPKNA